MVLQDFGKWPPCRYLPLIRTRSLPDHEHSSVRAALVRQRGAGSVKREWGLLLKKSTC